ncbi:hypothetical protein DCAR_0520489 [Daucus carota subsp. sativus]|uniref:Uncharacterized protein n=1 Tax=Daucus carota subsp. sativus TaxID=79200 RepID=A0A162A3G1_DAUCS|nr:hypothetical protein DCAR_0520489 [Daucus carota subsp. sativus]
MLSHVPLLLLPDLKLHVSADNTIQHLLSDSMTPDLVTHSDVVGINPQQSADAASALGWPQVVCRERRFKIFDLEVGALSGISNSEVPVVQAVYASMKGLIKMHNPSVVITINDIDLNVMKALKMATETNTNGSVLILLPRSSVSKALWMADLRATALPKKFKPKPASLAASRKQLLLPKAPPAASKQECGGSSSALKPQIDDSYIAFLEDI